MKDVILGCYDINNTTFDFCFLLGKFFIHMNLHKITQQTTLVTVLKNYLKNKFRAKESYLCSKNQMHIFWGNLATNTTQIVTFLKNE